MLSRSRERERGHNQRKWNREWSIYENKENLYRKKGFKNTYSKKVKSTRKNKELSKDSPAAHEIFIVANGNHLFLLCKYFEYEMKRVKNKMIK